LVKKCQQCAKRQAIFSRGNYLGYYISQAAARIEFLAIMETALRDGQILTMSDLHSTIEEALTENEASETTCSRKKLKALLESEIQMVKTAAKM